MTRYSQIIRASSAGAFALTPTGDWTVGETGADILTALTALYSATAAAGILDVAYVDDNPYAGEFRNVATQHVVDAYTLPRDPGYGTAGPVQRLLPGRRELPARVDGDGADGNACAVGAHHPAHDHDG